MSIIVTLLWNQKYFLKIQSDESSIENTCRNKILEICKMLKMEPKELSFEKISAENTNGNSSLKEFTNNDKINMTRVSTPRKRRQTSAAEGNKENLAKIFSLSKSLTKEILNCKGQQPIYNFFTRNDKINDNENPVTNCEASSRKTDAMKNLPNGLIRSETTELNSNSKTSSSRELTEPNVKRLKTEDLARSSIRAVNKADKVSKEAQINTISPHKLSDTDLETSLKDLYLKVGDTDPKFDSLFKKLHEVRRKFIISDKPPSVKQVKTRFPYLFTMKQAFAEFELIARKENMFERFAENVEKLSCFIIKSTIAESPFKEEMLRLLRKTEDKNDKKWFQSAISLFLLPNYLGEPRFGILLFHNEFPLRGFKSCPVIKSIGDAMSCLQKETEFKVNIEGITIFKATNIVEAYFGLMAVYYIFNAVYPDLCWKTFNLMEKLYTEYAPDPETFEPDDETKVQILMKYSSYRDRYPLEDTDQVRLGADVLKDKH